MYPGKITDIDGILVGHYTDHIAKTGCTVIHSQTPAIGGVDVRGCSPGTRETDLLRGYNLVEHVNAIMLCGGSAFGLAAADGAMKYFSSNKIGLDVGVATVPIIPAAVIFDLSVGDANIRPDSEAGYKACQNMDADCAQGAVGCGTGATIGKFYDAQNPVPSGVGTACITMPNGVKIGAIIAVNACGNVHDYQTGKMLKGNAPKTQFDDVFAGANTTIGVIATNATLTREQANKLASISHNGLAMSIRPVHMPFDGDTMFALATCRNSSPQDPTSFSMLLHFATQVCAQAIANAVAH